MLVFECQPAVRDMVQVLRTFKVDTPDVYVQVGEDQNIAYDEDFIGGWSGGVVCMQLRQ